MIATSEPRWDVHRTTETIRHHAALGDCTTYGNIATINGFAWSARIRTECIAHLDDVCAHALSDADALISAVVVNQGNLSSRRLSPFALKGFIKCAERLKRYFAEDAEAFLSKEQDATFRWARGEPR